ncbi:hypothetical protein O5D80_004482 [Batrachochytrium dendrobatidis]|nr:hypothetical protein O5D80_004482 [Batrachochytrium dendrobatidis]
MSHISFSSQIHESEAITPFPLSNAATRTNPRTEHPNFLESTHQSERLLQPIVHPHLQQYAATHSKGTLFDASVLCRDSNDTANGPPMPSLERKPKRGASFIIPGSSQSVMDATTIQTTLTAQAPPTPADKSTQLSIGNSTPSDLSSEKQADVQTFKPSDETQSPQEVATFFQERLAALVAQTMTPPPTTVAAPTSTSSAAYIYESLEETCEDSNNCFAKSQPTDQSNGHMDETAPSLNIPHAHISRSKSTETRPRSAPSRANPPTTTSPVAGDGALLEENIEYYQMPISQRRASSKDVRRKSVIAFIKKAVVGTVHSSSLRDETPDLGIGKFSDDPNDEAMGVDRVESVLPEPAYVTPRIEQKKRRSIFSAMSGSIGTNSRENIRPVTISGPIGLVKSNSSSGAQIVSPSGGSSGLTSPARLSGTQCDSSVSGSGSSIAGPNAMMLAMMAFAATAASQQGQPITQPIQPPHLTSVPRVSRSRSPSGAFATPNPTLTTSGSTKHTGVTTRPPSPSPLHPQQSLAQMIPPPPVVPSSPPTNTNLQSVSSIMIGQSSTPVMQELVSPPESPSIVRIEKLQKRHSAKSDVYAKRIAMLEESVKVLQEQVATLLKSQKETNM